MNVTQAQTVARQISSHVKIVHSNIEALLKAIDIEDLADIRFYGQNVETSFEALHKKLGVADVAGAELFNRLHKLVLGGPNDPHLRPVVTLSGGTPKDPPPPEPGVTVQEVSVTGDLLVTGSVSTADHAPFLDGVEDSNLADERAADDLTERYIEEDGPRTYDPATDTLKGE